MSCTVTTSGRAAHRRHREARRVHDVGVDRAPGPAQAVPAARSATLPCGAPRSIHGTRAARTLRGRAPAANATASTPTVGQLTRSSECT